MTKKDITQTRILHQGAMLINRSLVYERSKNICAIIVDMKSKRGDILCDGSHDDGSPTIAVESVKSSVHLNPKTSADDPTEIAFTDFKGWTVWSATVSKYTIYVCLVKEQQKNNDKNQK